MITNPLRVIKTYRQSDENNISYNRAIKNILREIQKLLKDKSHLKNILKKGSEKANIIAKENMKNIREKVGLI